MAGTVAPTTPQSTAAQPNAQPNLNVLNSILQDKQQAESAGAGTQGFNTAHTAALSQYGALKQAGIDPTQFQNMNASQLQSYINTNYHPQTGTTGSTALAQTGTTNQYPTLSGSLASSMINAVKNPTPTTGSTQDYANLNGEKLPTYQGRTFTTIDDLAKQTGIQYKKDPVTGAITINGNTINPIGYDQSGKPIVYVRQFLNAAGVNDQDIQYDPKTHNISYTAPQQSYADQLASSQPQMPQIQPYQAPDVSGFYNSMMPIQQQFTPDWNSYYQQAQNQINPLTQNSINMLMNKQAQDITKADEGLNAKGIFNSGIAVQMENQIRANTNDQVAKVIMNAQSNIAKTAQQLYTDAFNEWYKGNTFALQNNQDMLNQAMNQQKQAFQQWLSTQNLNMSQYNNALKAWDDVATLAQKDAQFQATQQLNYQKMMLPYTMGPTPAQMLPYEYQTANNAADNALKQYEFNNLSADQKANLAWDQYKFNNLSADQNATINLDYAKLTAQIHQWAADNQLKADQIGLDQAKLQEKSQYDQAMIDKASAAAQDTATKTQFSMLKAQLDDVTKQITAYQNNGKEPPQDLVDKYNEIMNAVDKLNQQSASSVDTSQLVDENGNPIGNGPFPLTNSLP